MTWGFAAGRRAEEFDTLVDRTVSTGELPTTRDSELLELVGALRAVPPVVARPEFVADLRAQLMAEAETALVPDDLSRLRLPARRTGRERRLAAVIGGIAVVGATTSVAVAAQSALPGDSLYPVKRAIEQAHTGISVGEGSKGATVLASASDRLDEVTALTQRDGLADDLRIAGTLATFTDQATEASDLLLADYAHSGNADSIAKLRDFTAASLDQLAALEPLVPADARDELIRAAGVLSTIDSQAAQQCATCGGAGITSIPPVLMAGESIFVPNAPLATEQAGHHGRRGDQAKGADDGKDDGPSLPDVDPNDLGPGSVNQGDTTTAGGDQSSSDPIGSLTQGLTGGGDSSTDAPSVPVVSGVVEGVVDDTEAILGGVLDPLTGQQSTDAP